MRHYLKYLLSILLISLSLIVYAKGSSGKYYIKGVAYGTQKTVLANIFITVQVGDKVQQIKTDDKGQFEFEVRWIMPSRSGISNDQWQQSKKRLNPEFIYVTWGNIEIKLKNEWEKYAVESPENKEEVTKKEDLIFDDTSKQKKQ